MQGPADPHDFVITLRQRLHEVRGRKVFVDILDGTWDWIAFFLPLGLNATGIAASAAHPDVCFSKRFLQWRDLPKLSLPGWELDVPPVFQDTARHPQDVVMVCKQFWADNRLSQPPILWTPHSWFDRLRPVPWARRERNPLSDRMVQEYNKTATLVVVRPWCLLRSGAYLTEWVANNQSKTYPSPPSIQSLVGAVSNGAWADDMAVEWRDYAPAPPTLIGIGPDRKRKRAPSARPIGPEPVPAPAPLRADEEVELPGPDDLDNLSVAVEARAAAPGRGGIAAARVPVAAAAAAAVVPVAATAAMPPRPPLAPPVRRRPAAAPAPKAIMMGMSLGCSKCRGGAAHGCTTCQCVEWRRRCTACEADSEAERRP